MWCRQTEKKKFALVEDMKQTEEVLKCGLTNVEEVLYWTDNLNARLREARKGKKNKKLAADYLVRKTLKYVNYAVKILNDDIEIKQRKETIRQNIRVKRQREDDTNEAKKEGNIFKVFKKNEITPTIRKAYFDSEYPSLAGKPCVHGSKKLKG